MSFHISIKPGTEYLMVKNNQSILEAAKEKQIALPHSCSNGKCAKCKCKVLSGSFEISNYSNKALTDQEKSNNIILTCKTYPLSDMVIQYDHLIDKSPSFKTIGRVISIERKTVDVIILKIKISFGERFLFKPGQYVDFLLKNGEKRSYSIANSPFIDQYLEFHIKHFFGGLFTDQLFGLTNIHLKEDDILRLEGPFGSFILQEKSKNPIIFLASGTGFAPIKSMMEYIIRENIFSQPIYLYWGARKLSDIYMNDLAKSWESLIVNFKYRPVLINEISESMVNIPEYVMKDFKDLSSFQIYACGSNIMIESAKRDFITKCRLPVNKFYSDAFIST
ncbi:2Fe-2S iron-sulfur cluster-binding protein [Candidatus Kinetoplastidibacterium crithidiae]|uniref:CDP-4-dehydro-6-deoxyglucose reductase n=1 Tax=Candidatus Kinetoplastidibacterium crithidiae TCC036E TaxID=1208918 RepID=M1L4T1_9PROT|nr:2Fe-2S iron-sulfur cluster-binding protein [Candidatus Kinetoplastibacterium crithidii]AFZ82651.1 CDP-4-dehydro-6-deoxyglucose reductase [Candidatus Kinetoplastibacterium crithidii (ex Angomonas deanei ATCC 30255)]AGF47688.1 CDP-4-dehydro-6-deoxyglucose reductase [Candidatus Kinetoplastibacterium crithidii TCC036E]